MWDHHISYMQDSILYIYNSVDQQKGLGLKCLTKIKIVVLKSRFVTVSLALCVSGPVAPVAWPQNKK